MLAGQHTAFAVEVRWHLVRLVLFFLCSAAAIAVPACRECHSEIDSRQAESRHRHALEPILESPSAAVLLKEPIAEARGEIRYRYQTSPNGLLLTTQRGSQTASAIIEWAFGAGAVGRTVVGRFRGQYFEHRLSYYTELGRPSLTPGQPPETPVTAEAAIGELQSPDLAFRCFNCHATNVKKADAGPDLSEAIPGIHCERCHGPGTAHVTAAHGHKPAAEIRSSIFDPRRLPPKAIVEVCGECHRAPKPGQLSSTPELDDPLAVRYQPFGLMASRCFIESKQLSCLTCHDPHDNARRKDDAFYTHRCLSCHDNEKRVASRITKARQSACKRALKENCLPCHMQRVTPAPYLTFTDHRIRIYR